MGFEQKHGNSPVPKNCLQQQTERLLNQKSGVVSFQEREVDGSTFVFLVAYSEYESIEDLERKYGFPPDEYVIGRIGERHSFIKKKYTRGTFWDNSDGWNDATETYHVKSSVESVKWLMLPGDESIPQIITYNHSYTSLPQFRPYDNDVLAVGFEYPFKEHYYQVGLYNTDGTFDIHSYCGKDSQERQNWSTVKPIPFYAYGNAREIPWLQTHTEKDELSVRIQETLDGNLVHELIFPKQINPNLAVWKTILFDEDNSIAFDSSLPWVSWFTNLGIRLKTVYPR